MKLAGPVMNIIRPETMPQVTMMRAIHTRAPTRCRMTLLGTSNRKYPRKKIPAPQPYT